MKKRIQLLVAAGCLSLCFLSCSQPPYKNPALTPEERADDLVSRLTLEEKAALMQSTSPAIPRLGIKAYDWWNEALHGVGRAGLATVFPQAIGMGASFDSDLLYDVFTAVSDEARAKNAAFSREGELKRYQGLTVWTPNINIFRDPRWGRGQETYGEDPYLTGQMGMAVVRGLQGPDSEKYDKLHACAKHFAVHSGPEWNRHSFNAEKIDPRDLWETYLPAFKDLVCKADVKEVMCAYNRFEGEPCCGSNRLLVQILRNEWNYKGIIVSDCWAINDFFNPGAHETEPDKEHASAKAVLTGTDVECGQSYASLPQAVAEGLIDEEKIDVSLKRLMKARFELGEMDRPELVSWAQIPYSVVDSKEHRELALRMARESLVLLQNNGNLLPLNKEMKIALVGPNANDSVMQWGNYNGFPGHTATLLEGLRQYLPESRLIYEPGCDLTSDVTLQSVFQQCSMDGKQGFSAKYWNNPKQEGEPDVTAQITTPFHFITTGATAFAAGVNLTDFSASYESVFRPEKSEEIAFHFQTQGFTRLSINNEEVAKGMNFKNNIRTYALSAEAGKEYHIRIDFAFHNRDAALDFDMGREIPVDLSQTVQRVKDADVIVFAGGISPAVEGEEMRVTIPGFKGGDREVIELPSIQSRLLAELKKAGKKVVLVNFSGSAIALTPETKTCDAILQAWYPGQAGGTAIANVLFGDYNPAGRLPVTFYKSTSQLPDFEDYSMKGRTYRYMTEAPLFPFGHGLSYTTFSYGNAALSAPEIKDGETLTLTIPVSNTGTHDGDEVVQVYLRRPSDKEGPSHTLRAFRRVSIAHGATENVTISLNKETFEWFDTQTNTMRPIEGDYELLYGGCSEFGKLKAIAVTVK
ncbi:xylan 1,4-beta-xylosidase [uncultured Bacteroides sp.]|uniref:xylan 1,4-beta-xylosidase n=1 Tax=uncultured Bacteroides sp. TaxID=162156 RepID=UPI002638A7AE|nr:xylan 1,4-beta-xylosidase [uncultured Bacteroides sp.]